MLSQSLPTPWPFKMFFDFGFWQFYVISLYVVFFINIWLGTLWVCRLMSLISFGKFSAIISVNTGFTPCSLPFLGCQLHLLTFPLYLYVSIFHLAVSWASFWIFSFKFSFSLLILFSYNQFTINWVLNFCHCKFSVLDFLKFAIFYWSSQFCPLFHDEHSIF